MLTTPDHDDALTSRPALSPVGPKPKGYYGDCDAATGQQGTTFRAEDFNELIDNLRQVVFTAAAVAPVKGRAQMLLDALDRRYAGHVAQAVATRALTLEDAGLVLVDATTADVTLTLPTAASFPTGGPTFIFVRTDTSTYTVRIVPQAGQRIVGGVASLDSTPLTLRSDGVLSWYRSVVLGSRIARSATINVAPSGVPRPDDPLGGTPFDNLQSALTWLGQYTLDTAATMTINIAAGTYVHTAGILFDHPDATRINIVGAGSATTILQFNGVQVLFTIWKYAGQLSKLTIRGDHVAISGTQIGVAIDGGFLTIIDDVIITNCATTNVRMTMGGVLQLLGSLKVTDSGDKGIHLSGNGTLVGGGAGVITLENNANVTGQLLVESGSAAIKTLNTKGGVRGLAATTAAARIAIGTLQVLDCTDTAHAVYVTSGGFLQAEPSGLTWEARASAGTPFYVFFADNLGNILVKNSIVAGNRAITSPPVNTYGNQQGYILAW